MEYSGQHNGKGKLHLIGEEDIVCGSSGVFNCTSSSTIIFDNGIFYEKFIIHELSSPHITHIYEDDYCKKCLNKIRNKK